MKQGINTDPQNKTGNLIPSIMSESNHKKEKGLKFFRIIAFILSVVLSYEAHCRLTKEESIALVKEAVDAKYIEVDTAEKLMTYFSNSMKRQELSAELSAALISKKPTDQNQAILQTAKILGMQAPTTQGEVGRLKALANLLLPCWTGGMTVSRISSAGQSLSWILQAGSFPREAVLMVLNGWTKSDVEKMLSLAKYANGKNTDTMLYAAVDLTASQIERSLRLIAYCEMEDSLPEWKSGIAIDFQKVLPIKIDITQEPLVVNTFMTSSSGLAGNCLYTTLRHLMLILTTQFGDDHNCTTFSKIVPNSSSFCGLGLSRLLILNNNDFIKLWDEFSLVKQIDHFPTLQGIASGLAKLATQQPVVLGDFIENLMIDSVSQLAGVSKTDIVCKIIDFGQNKHNWMAGLLILGSRSKNIYIGIGFSDLYLKAPKKPTGCHTEIIGIWKDIQKSQELDTTYLGLQIHSNDILN